MSDTIIKIENISKQYRLGLISTGTLSHDLNRWFTTSILRKEDPYLKIGDINDRSSKGKSDYVWALRDINLDIKQGELLGIIGRNGAGKSTLLKLLSRVTKPTTGTIKYRGKIASLLEVGTGFHPEMTGRENIYMNGAIMGMTRREITRKLDEIVDFSGCERYLDTPVKRYSSGMTVRLGFAIAAHIEPDILVVDEVLAVGDAEFQKKAIGKMKEVSSEGGRTVLFVSHNMPAVKSLCKTGIILKNGMLVEQGDVDTIVSHYLRGDSGAANYKFWNDKPEVTKEGFELLEVGIRKKGGDYSEPMRIDQELELVLRYRLTQDYNEFHITWHLKNEQGAKVFSFGGSSQIGLNHPKGEYEQVCTIPANYFNWGSFSLDLYVVKDRKNVFLVEPDLINFTLGAKEQIGGWMGREPGDIRPVFPYSEAKLKKL